VDVDQDWPAVVARALAGDGAAFAVIVRATQRDVWRLCAYLVDPQSADDLSQETYVRAVRGLGTYTFAAPLRPWILSIARRACADEIRQRTRRRRLIGRLSGPAPQPDATGEVELLLLLGTLTPERREAFVLTQLLGLSYDEAALAADCPIGTIRSRVSRARGDLAHALQDQEDQHGDGDAGTTARSAG
jgi:RNA polymerase sigma-70 factor (ECF subfamily)